MPSNPLVSIVILNWNGADLFPACIASLQRSTYHPLELILIDNGSSDRSIEIARSLGPVRIIENGENLGYAGGNNRALPFINGKYVCFINPDVEVAPAWLEYPVEHLEKEPVTAAVACLTLNYFRNGILDGAYHYLADSLSIFRYGNDAPLTDDPLFGEPGYVISALGASALYRTDVVRSLGGFYEPFFAYYEEADLCMRINNSGFRCVYSPTSVVQHRVSAHFSKVRPSSQYYYHRNKRGFVLRNFPAAFIRKHAPANVYEKLYWLRRFFLHPRALAAFLQAQVDSRRLFETCATCPETAHFDESFVVALMKEKKLAIHRR